MKADLIEKAVGLLARELNRDTNELLPAKKLREDLGMDSIIALNVMFLAEKELNLIFREEDLVALVTVQDLLNLVDRLAPA